MFGGKKEKVLILEEELQQLREEKEKKEAKLFAIAAEKDNLSEQFARMTASRAQMEKEIDRAKEQLGSMDRLAESRMQAAADVHSAMVGMNNGIGTFEVNHAVFLNQVKAQNDTVKEIMDADRQLQEPIRFVSEMSGSLREENRGLTERADRMEDLAKNMGAMALSAAIDAGRMGEGALDFIHSVEAIRSFSESYEKEAEVLHRQAEKAEKRIEELEEQVGKLTRLWKEHNSSMAKLMQSGMQSTASYEGGQLKLRDLISDTAVGQADALTQSEEEMEKLKEGIGAQLENIRVECAEQKNCADELEMIYQKVHKSTVGA